MNIYGKDWKDENNYEEYDYMKYDLLEIVGTFFLSFAIVYIVMKIFT